MTLGSNPTWGAILQVIDSISFILEEDAKSFGIRFESYLGFISTGLRNAPNFPDSARYACTTLARLGEP